MPNSWTLPFAIAHRGASKLAPENTVAALKAAKKSDAQWVECDIQLTKDSQPVIFHDAALARTTNGRGLLSETPFSKIKTLDAGSWFSPTFKKECVPTLQEWLQIAANLKLGLNLELKANTKTEAIFLAESLIDHLKKYWPAHSTNLLISSSNYFALMQVHERAKSLPLGLICDTVITEKKAAELLNANIISLHQPYKILNADYIQMLQKTGLYVLAFTVNDKIQAEKLKQIGVDGLFTDNEDLFLM